MSEISHGDLILVLTLMKMDGEIADVTDSDVSLCRGVVDKALNTPSAHHDRLRVGELLDPSPSQHGLILGLFPKETT